MSDLFDLHVRLAFPGQVRTMAETASAMAAWAHAAAGVLGPELRWSAQLAEDQDREGGGRWSSRHVLTLRGLDGAGVQRGRGEARLVAGGDLARMGGNGLVELETVRPSRYLFADNHCDVTHWDLRASPLLEGQIEGLRRALEEILGQAAELGGERREPVVRAPQLLGTGASTEDAALWIEELGGAGLACRGHASAQGVSVLVERACLADVDALDRARLVLGEALAEAGHEDWIERTRELLVRLPEGQPL